MSQITKQLYLRLPLDLHAKVVAAAAENNRSGNTEMLHRLEQSFSEPAPAGHTTVDAADLEEVFTKVFTGCFTKLEERVAQILDTPPLYSITPADDLTKEEFEALRDQLKAGGEYAQLSDLYQRHFQRFDLRGRPGTASPTGRLSESQPKLQDLPDVSGWSTLAASFKAGCSCGGGVAGFRRAVLGEPYPYHTGGFTGLPEGELPNILEKGERVMSQPFTGQTWVITGSLETMTRDRAREIIMELGGSVAGAIDERTNVLLWGPGAGSKKERAESFGIRLRNERQFIELIRKHGVDMPLPKESEWIENTGSRPVDLRPDQLIETQTRPYDAIARRLVGDIPRIWWGEVPGDLPHITRWRLAK